MPPSKLHLGCGHTRLDGFVNCDLYPNPNVDSAFDCQKDWPFPDNSASTIYASHLLEHLDDPWAFFREAHRVLIPNGSMLLRVPAGGDDAAWFDLTHKRPWFAETFCFLQPGYSRSIGNPQGHHWNTFFGVETIDQRISGKFAKWIRWRLYRSWLLSWTPQFRNVVEELWARLYALKTPEAIQQYERTHVPNVVNSRYVMYTHQYLRQKSQPNPNYGGLDLTDLSGMVPAISAFHAWH